eukprot:NODE_6011_length_583_cov_16.625000_g5846_i0.p1 GENE.NODE_6011_length_583_cov_16.625000_g5846_i0~~NODE_6011_length_583_cov_16.625000_g5846_i0.p1  ORF type:complete len:170 (+),score=17.65 NODE_6011_length_583_cov_16.625000_g5846_i0:60-569(+)
MLIIEYRVPLPFTLSEYQRGQVYSIARQTLDTANTTQTGERVEFLINEPIRHPEWGEGRYTKKLIHLGNRLPRWLARLAPPIYVVEESWNCFPNCRSVYRSPLLGETFQMTCESRHLANDVGGTENVMGLRPEELKQRKVVKHRPLAQTSHRSSRARCILFQKNSTWPF